MKKIIFLIVGMMFFITAFSYETVSFVFKDHVIKYIITEESKIEIEDGYSLLWVSGNSDYYLEKKDGDIPFEIINQDDLKKYSLFNYNNKYYYDSEKKYIFYYDSKFASWVRTSYDNYMNSQKTYLNISGGKDEHVVALTASGGWNVYYELMNDGTFTEKIRIYYPEDINTHVFLINSYYNNNSSDNYVLREAMFKSLAVNNSANGYSEEKILDEYVIDLGNLDIKNGEFVLFKDSYKIYSWEDISVINLKNGYTQDYQKAEYFRKIENDKYNGLGYIFPGGDVWFFDNFSDINLAYKKGNIDDSYPDSDIYIDLGGSNDVKYKVTTVSNSNFGTEKTSFLKYKIEISNYGENDKKVEIRYNYADAVINMIATEGQIKYKDNSEKGIISIDTTVTGDAVIYIELKIERR